VENKENIKRKGQFVNLAVLYEKDLSRAMTKPT
jgi:hypothetical protein